MYTPGTFYMKSAILNFDFDLPGRPRCRFLGSPGGWFRNLSKCSLKINTKRRFEKKKDIRF